MTCHKTNQSTIVLMLLEYLNFRIYLIFFIEKLIFLFILVEIILNHDIQNLPPHSQIYYKLCISVILWNHLNTNKKNNLAKNIRARLIELFSLGEYLMFMLKMVIVEITGKTGMSSLDGQLAEKNVNLEFKIESWNL